jgi:hypothetical protein
VAWIEKSVQRLLLFFFWGISPLAPPHPAGVLELAELERKQPQSRYTTSQLIFFGRAYLEGWAAYFTH